MSHSILIVEDDMAFATMLRTWLSKKGFEADVAGSHSKARKQISEKNYDMVLSDLRLPDDDGLSLIAWMRKNGHTQPIIIMTGYADIQSAVSAIKNGAADYVAKPVQPDILLKKINETLTEPAPSAPQKESKRQEANDYLEGNSDAARKLYSHVALVAPTPMSVLINGASGTGKEYVAHRIHRLSKRADGPFVAIDCGSIPKELAASEFFGHVKGSFTGALEDKTGAFVEADGGTLFLDEIGNLSYEVQVQLLRALQERRIRPVGSTKEIKIDVRLVSATNENLQQAIEDGTFREDLFHRINEFTLRMPALKDRDNDIMLFANFFLDMANRELGKHITGFDSQTCRLLQTYAWPGNLRQLKNVVTRAALLAQGSLITAKEVEEELAECGKDNEASHTRLHDEKYEKERIARALQQAGNNKSKAAELLGIDRKTLYNKLRKYDL
ncbi:MAG: sigma-54 dependent transcriptional regulator [Bacteroides sp.]|nr:sigma-54 dependent transcriptional regulator [Roseburia sp.]MCM1346675.1 sigma-54 dependent transcriptional regulator [Bacteroides sp.]MCM1422143.1 sigma-54 dependent transcriptional regulator [Bacteroides sp.]